MWRHRLPNVTMALALAAAGCAVWTIGPSVGLRGPEVAALTLVAGLLFGRRLLHRCKRLTTCARRTSAGSAG